MFRCWDKTYSLANDQIVSCLVVPTQCMSVEERSGLKSLYLFDQIGGVCLGDGKILYV